MMGAGGVIYHSTASFTLFLVKFAAVLVCPPRLTEQGVFSLCQFQPVYYFLKFKACRNRDALSSTVQERKKNKIEIL